MWWIIYAYLKRRKIRVFLTMLGIAVGVATLFTILSISDGIDLSINQEMYSVEAQIFIVPYGHTHHRIMGIMEGDVEDTMPASVHPQVKEVDNVKLAVPVLMKKAKFEDVKMVLKKLDKQYKIGLISNSGITPGRILRKVLDKLEVLRYLDCTVFSDEMGYTKPHQLIFREAIKILQSNPHETAHIGDLLQTDVAGAKSFGMKTVWLNRAGEVNKSDIKPDYEVRRLSQIIEILKA